MAMGEVVLMSDIAHKLILKINATCPNDIVIMSFHDFLTIYIPSPSFAKAISLACAHIHTHTIGMLR